MNDSRYFNVCIYLVPSKASLHDTLVLIFKTNRMILFCKTETLFNMLACPQIIMLLVSGNTRLVTQNFQYCKIRRIEFYTILIHVLQLRYPRVHMSYKLNRRENLMLHEWTTIIEVDTLCLNVLFTIFKININNSKGSELCYTKLESQVPPTVVQRFSSWFKLLAVFIFWEHGMASSSTQVMSYNRRFLI